MQILRDVVAMIRDLRAESPGLRIWGPLLNVPLMLGGLIFFTQPAGWVTLVTNGLALIGAGQIHKRRRFSRLSSVVHLLWIPAVPLLLEAVRGAPSIGAFEAWCAFTLLTMGISGVMDVLNIFLFSLTENKTFRTQTPADANA